VTAPEPLPLFWLPQAQDDRVRQLDFLSKHDPQTALRMGDAVAAAAARLSTFPDVSRVGRIAGARELAVPETPFVIVYRIENKSVVILRLLHHRRRWPSAEDMGEGRADILGTLPSRAMESMTKTVSDLQARISKLPRRAQRDIERAVAILREEFAAAVAGSKASHRHDGKILKIILFGSYARGRQVVDPVGRYFSDYDLLVVVDHDDLTDASKYWDKAEDRMVDMLADGFWPQPLTLIVHSLDDINYQLRRGRYFFVDIVKEGIALFEEPGFPFEKPGILTKQEAQEEARRYYNSDFTGIDRSLQFAQFARSKSQAEHNPLEQAKWRNEAAFQLHQATERAYYCILLVLLLYKPKSHSLNFLSKRCEQLDERLIGLWKQDSKLGKRCYELLRAAYIKARYSEFYKIDDEELDWLTERVTQLQVLTRTICEERLER